MSAARRMRCGAGALAAVLGLAALAAAWLAAHYAGEDAARQRALAREAGRVFGAWVLAAHRAGQARDFSGRLAAERAFTLAPAALRAMGAAAPDLPARAGRDAAFAVGLMDDGAGVAMAFGVLEPGRGGDVPSMRAGAAAAGLARVAEAGAAATPMAAHVPELERALGRTLAPGTLYATADFGVRYREGVLYRRAQPGRPWLNRMETDLNAGGRTVASAGAAAGRSAAVAGDAQVQGGGAVSGDAAAARLEADSLEAGALDAAGLAVSGELVVGRASAGAVSAGSAAISGRLEAGGLRTGGALTAGTLAVAGAAAVAGTTAAGTLAGETLAVAGTLRTQRAALTGLYGPDARFGRVTVTQCRGC